MLSKFIAKGYGLYYAAVRGDERRILFGYDFDGDLCGVSDNVRYTNITGSGKNTNGFP